MLKIGIIGYGYWGPNIVRNCMVVEDINVIAVCDRDGKVLTQAKKNYPHIEVHQDPQVILKSSEIDAVVIATPVQTHYTLALNALKNGKHIFITKPFTSNSKEAQELVQLAKKKKLKIMVDHTFLFTGAVKKIKNLIDENVLGDLLYYDSTRVNLGRLQHDVNVVWDLAPHDFSIMEYVIKSKPIAITANGAAHFHNGLEDIAYITIYFPNNIIAHVHVNWISPVKVRTTLIGGKKKMVVWDDVSVEKIKVYDKGVTVKSKKNMYRLLVDYRSGDVVIPQVDFKEALQDELEYFVSCIENNKTPINDGCSGLRVVKMLEAANESLKQKGKLIKL